ncbi:hypothetical protein DPMN_082605 [Dreissena polymorpha]|uniref:BEN domain-containing protein n=1 Tax=Dreissena polymorpha TaxID=45954 RepID=A0A9D3YB92_DREPO|nr:hypothetical protein DPMN_082605 [Dreissena polymorpha]
MMGTLIGMLAQSSRPQTTELSDATGSENGDIPARTMISNEELRSIRAMSSNSGNFAAHLVRRLFPKLFTAANIKSLYNYNGGGQNKKQPLSPTRKSAVKRYVTRFFPEVRDPEAWNAQCVSKINEILRRPVRPPR